MRLSKKIVLFLIAVIVLLSIKELFVSAIQPNLGKDLAIAAVNGDNNDWAALNTFERNKSVVTWACNLFIVMLGVGWFWPKKSESTVRPNNRGTPPIGGAAALLALGFLFFGTGCAKYDVPEYREVKTSETAYVLPLEGATSAQVKFDSAAFLEQHKVAAKRIQIPHRRNKTGRMYTDGSWIPTIKVIVVDRSPVTVEWRACEDAKGHVVKDSRDQAIWIESADSVGFAMGWTCTAYVKEEDASQFLYMYPSGSLKGVLDTEVRARIQMVAAQEAAKYKLDNLRDKKNEIAAAVKADVIEFFTKRGITITTVGMFGGMTYENDSIQESIDKTFIAQQEKVNSAAMLAAQNDKNARIQSEALALAEAARTKAKGEADGNLAKLQAEASGAFAKSEAEAKGVDLVNKALEKAQGNPVFLQSKALDVERIKAQQWSGNYPSTVIGSGANLWIGLGDKGVQPVPISK